MNRFGNFTCLSRLLNTSGTRPTLKIHEHQLVQSRRGTFGRGPTYQRFGQSSQQGRQGPLWQRIVASPNFYWYAGAGGLAGGIFYISNLETVPVSGRRRFNIVSEALEKKTADQFYQQVLNQYRGRILLTSDRRHQLVQRVLQRLIPFSGLENEDWRIHVVQDNEPNAFVIPGGKVFVHTGILPICEDEAGVAVVLGHEISHTVARHSAERQSRMWFIVLGAVLLAWYFGIPDTLSANLASLGFERPNGRAQESEADYIGLLMMARACYDPRTAKAFWHRMQKAGGGEIPQFLSTHPSHQNRESKIESWLPKAEEQYDESGCSRTSSSYSLFRNASRTSLDS